MYRSQSRSLLSWWLPTFMLLVGTAGCACRGGGQPPSGDSIDGFARDLPSVLERSEPELWFEVDAPASRRLENEKVYHQGPEAPVLLRRVPAQVESTLGRDFVVVEAVLSPQGRVARARVLMAAKTPGLNQPLVEALSKWRFEPARLEGEPVAVYYTLTVQLEIVSES